MLIRDLRQWIEPAPCPAGKHDASHIDSLGQDASRSWPIRAAAMGRSGAWKQEIQREPCNSLGLSVTVSRYPSGASKWSPIGHRLFSQISRNWAAESLDSYEKALKLIRTTATPTGLKVTAHLDTTYYPTGVKVSKQELS
jgi:hypothetical protein